ncbi:MBL fold metallo-hydrolase [Propionibacteriaceae bacterium Y1923]|uniref:MBL fold metallo-hydrolase n=1 Tax=Aestuariimicrobium sp. Y1814 TaxID=3418742 RepID=UPI003C1378E8
MQITHLGHACVLVEAAGRRILVDPGNFSDAWHGLTGLDAVLATHQHPDHFDPDHGPRLVAANPDAVVALEASLAAQQPDLAARALVEGEELDLGGGVQVRAVGGEHAVIHTDIPRIGNVGLVIEVAGGQTFFHPGDALDTVPSGVDVLAVPAHGPWAAMKEHIDFIRAVGAPHGFLVHDGLLSERGWALAFNRYQEMSATDFVDLRHQQPHRFTD